MGQMLSQHAGVAKVSFTGQAATGQAVMRDASASLKAVTMELGGKSPLLIFHDADMDNAVAGALMANFYSNGQVRGENCRMSGLTENHTVCQTLALDPRAQRPSAGL